MGPSAQTTVRVALVEDHRETRDELARLLTGFHPRVALVATFPDAESFLEDPVRLALDVALVDLAPGATGIEAIQVSEVDATHATRSRRSTTSATSRCAGAYGYLLDEPPDRVLAGIEEAAGASTPVGARGGFLVAGRGRKTSRRPPRAIARTSSRRRWRPGRREGAESMGIALGVQDYEMVYWLDVNPPRGAPATAARR